MIPISIELLAPAGDFERLKVNLLYGADAVYVGIDRFNLRANATNFSYEDLKEGCDFAHQIHKKVYFTFNIVFHDEDREEMEKIIEQVVSIGVDAFIVSDLYLIHYLHTKYPQKEIHVSTQESITNYEEALFYKDLGVSRIVLARELSKDEIKEIIDQTGLEVEVFIQGAMCTCYSGRCALSSYVTNRDPNRGGCSQVCRFTFDGGEEKKFTLATKDLNLVEYIKTLIDIGVTSFKVEGRMRSIYYLATVVGTYRKIIDAYYHGTLDDTLIKQSMVILSRVSNRETSTHYLLKEADENDQYYTGRQELSNQDYLGQVIGYDQEKKRIIMKERNYFKVGDVVELFTPKGKTYTFQITEIYDEKENVLDVARHPDQQLLIPFPEEVEEYSMLRKAIL